MLPFRGWEPREGLGRRDDPGNRSLDVPWAVLSPIPGSRTPEVAVLAPDDSPTPQSQRSEIPAEERPGPPGCEACRRPLAPERAGERWCEECAFDAVSESRDEAAGIVVMRQRDGGVMIVVRGDGEVVFDSLDDAHRFLARTRRLLHLLGR